MLHTYLQPEIDQLSYLISLFDLFSLSLSLSPGGAVLRFLSFHFY